jgi:hypothetical protein
MKRWISMLTFLLFVPVARAALTVDDAAPTGADVSLFNGKSTADIYTDPRDASVVQIAAHLLADDFNRVTGQEPALRSDAAKLGSTAILIGTVGRSSVIDQLITDHKIDVSKIRGQWESFIWQTVQNPVPGVSSALVIAGSDRRGTAYGVVDLSKQIGVSPWYWWSDVPPTQHGQLRVSQGQRIEESPGIKYRGIFINDEDWGLRPWASKTFDPATGNIGPKTYAKIFELMLRLKLNFLWPAMHPGSAEFSTFPGNSELADKWAIVTGSSHCEPMLRNNVYWPKSNGPWRYDINHDAIFNYWKEAATTHGNDESVWTLGIRGIHDAPMQGPKDLHARVKMVEHAISDQRSLIDEFVTKKYGPPAECFVPYKEVLPLYDAGMKVPDDVTLVWPDDNYGYVRRLGTTAERQRSGGSGIYYHLSYWGSPHSYLWVESTPPALMWEELRKTYDNDSRSIWIVNVGDIKPAEVGIDFFAKLAFNPNRWGPDAQDKFLQQFCDQNFGSAGKKVADLEKEFFTLASVRKPEHIEYPWVDSLSSAEAADLKKRYELLLHHETEVAAAIPADRVNAYFETVGYAVRMLGATGLLYLGDDAAARQQKQYIDAQTLHFNEGIENGKWRRMMSETMEGLAWPKRVGGTAKAVKRTEKRPPDDRSVVVDAADCTQQTAAGDAAWNAVAGLGWSGRAITVLPAIPSSSWNAEDLTHAPSMTYAFALPDDADGAVRIDALPTLKLSVGGKLRIAVAIDDQTPKMLDIPGGEAGDENSKIRSVGVLTNRVTVTLKTKMLKAGKHTIKIFAVDPGVVLDQLELPAGSTFAH